MPDNEYGVSLWCDANVLELESGHGFITYFVNILKQSLNCTC